MNFGRNVAKPVATNASEELAIIRLISTGFFNRIYGGSMEKD